MTDILFLIAGFMVSALSGMVLISNILSISYKKRLFDMPDTRKVHTVPVPRLGGFSFLPVSLVSFCLAVSVRYCCGLGLDDLFTVGSVCSLLLLSAGGTALYLTGIADDLVGVGYRRKFAVQIAAALLLILPGNWLGNLGGLFGLYAIPSWAGIPLSVFLVVYITNAVNLIDGIDGLASGLCAIAFTAMGALLAVRGEYAYALLSFSFLGVLVPFWFYNVFGNARRHRKLFMGDAGSLTLGYVLCFLILHLSQEGPSAVGACSDLVFALSTLLVPLFDVVRVVLHRLREGKSPFMPDRNHFHHKLLRAGLTPKKAMALILGVSVSFIIVNLVLEQYIGITWILVTDLLLWTALQLLLDRIVRARESEKGDSR